MDLLYSAIKKAGIEVKAAAEVGVFSYESSSLRRFILDGVHCDLYEAVPEFCDHIKKNLPQNLNVELHCVAVTDSNGSLDLCLAGPSTFSASQDSSPAINHDGLCPEKVRWLTVPCRDFAELDPGNYDLVTIDTEGSEATVIARMRSRPKVLSVETQSRDYVNPGLGAITDWLAKNGYRVWLWNDTDSVFVRGEIPTGRNILQIIKAWIHNRVFFAGRL